MTVSGTVKWAISYISNGNVNQKKNLSGENSATNWILKTFIPLDSIIMLSEMSRIDMIRDAHENDVLEGCSEFCL